MSRLEPGYQEQIDLDKAEIERSKKLQDIHNKEVKEEMDSLLKEASDKGIFVPAGFNNPEALRDFINKQPIVVKKKGA